jgi:predicted ATP-dependent Lon-type protease
LPIFFPCSRNPLRVSPLLAETRFLRSLVEPLQIAMDNGAKKALIPLENKRSFLEVTGDIVEHVDPIFFGDPKTAAFKALGSIRM